MRSPSVAGPEEGGTAGPVLRPTPEDEVARVLGICNACRYCEGFCAVFPAMTRRLEFPKADIHYMANLCHNCGACLHSCQYAPPHAFAVNVPRAMAEVRAKTYQDYAWPPALGRLYRQGGLTAGLALAVGLSAFLILALVIDGTLVREPNDANFYAIFPHGVLVVLFSTVFLFAVAAMAVGLRRFWREVRTPGAVIGRPAVAETVTDVARLRYLDGGHGEGCNEQNDRFTLARRAFHQLTLYGFLLCFAATGVATLYHYLLRREAPYAWTSPPVALGVAGGIGLTIGVAGLFWLNLWRHPDHGDPAQRGTDRAFMGLLLLVSLTGFAVLFLRTESLMGLWLALHLGSVMALFLTLPYGKFVHGLFRCAALLKYAVERRLPSGLTPGSD